MPGIEWDKSISLMDAVHLMGVAGLGMWMAFGVQDGVEDNRARIAQVDERVFSVAQEFDKKVDELDSSLSLEIGRVVEYIKDNAKQMEVIRVEANKGQQRNADKLDAIMQAVVSESKK